MSQAKNLSFLHPKWAKNVERDQVFTSGERGRCATGFFLNNIGNVALDSCSSSSSTNGNVVWSNILFCKITHWLTWNCILCKCFRGWTSVRVALVEGSVNSLLPSEVCMLALSIHLFYLLKSFICRPCQKSAESPLGRGGKKSWYCCVLVQFASIVDFEKRK